MLYLKTTTEAMAANEVEAHINKEQTFLQTFTPFIVCTCVYHSIEFTSFNSCWCTFSSSNPKKMLLICLALELSQTEDEFPEDSRADSWLQTLAVLLLPEFQAHLSLQVTAQWHLGWRVTAEAALTPWFRHSDKCKHAVHPLFMQWVTSNRKRVPCQIIQRFCENKYSHWGLAWDQKLSQIWLDSEGQSYSLNQMLTGVVTSEEISRHKIQAVYAKSEWHVSFQRVKIQRDKIFEV